MTANEAIKLIAAFSQNQIRITKEANSRRGVTNRSVKEEKTIAVNLLEAIIGINADRSEVDTLIKSLEG